MVWGRVLTVLDSPVVREEAMCPQLPSADPSRPAGSRCTQRLNGLPKPPDCFRPQGGRLRRGRQITLGRILTERCKANSCQQKQGKSEVTLHLNKPTTMVPTVAHADGRSFLGPVVITAHLKPTRCQSASFIVFASSNNLPSGFLLPYNKSGVPSQRMPNRSSRLTRMSDRRDRFYSI